MNGLTSDEVSASRIQNGSNSLDLRNKKIFWQVLFDIVKEPMFLLLLLACVIYFIVGQNQEAFVMLVAILLVSGISLFQDYRSRNAVQALRKMSATRATVIRDGQNRQVPADEIVVHDLLVLEEGEIIAADGTILTSNDFSVNESILTGEAFAIHKAAESNPAVFKGTLVVSGTAMLRVDAVGRKTMFGKIGESMEQITVVKTPLQVQIRSFVRYMILAGAIAFALVVGINFYQSGNWLNSLLHGLTLAMSILPEEIPVAFSTFQALGAFRLLRQKVIVKEPAYVETLGSSTVICTDKTGTLTENKMSIEYVYDANSERSIHITDMGTCPTELISYAMWSSETNPFDPMEKAIHNLYADVCQPDLRPVYKQVHEYPIGGNPPMMTHIFRNQDGDVIIAVKGSTEAIMKHAVMTPDKKKLLEDQAVVYARLGLRVLGVGKASWNTDAWPAKQEEFSFEFLGLIAFQDPPKAGMTETIRQFSDAGIAVKMITGDFAETAVAVARQVGLQEGAGIMTGKEVIQLTSAELREKVADVNIYARMFPEAKLKVIEALKENGEVVAMTGDGVNDGPALKAAHIGIAMGSRGSDVARQAASLILMDDDLSHMTTAVAIGRKIYDNLKKAIQYIVSIHIPIIGIVTIPLVLGWTFTEIFTPVHVIFLELIMGPTCSVIYENEPMESGTMQRPPRKMGSTFLTWKQLSVSVIQGLVITAVCLGTGYYGMVNGYEEDMIRTMVFLCLLFSNIFLTLVNRSFTQSIWHTIHNRNPLVPLIIGITLVFIICITTIPYARGIFGLAEPGLRVLIISILSALVGTCWMEVWKWVKRTSKRRMAIENH